MSLNSDNDFFGEILEPVEELAPIDMGATEAEAAEAPGEELQRTLAFSCLKCAAITEIDFKQMPESGLATQCGSCKSRMHVVRESCAKRATQRSRELFCVKCGHQLDYHMHCPSCGLPLPDYFVVENPEEARRQAKNKRAASIRHAFADLDSSIRAVFAWRPSHKKEDGHSAKKGAAAATHKAGVLSKKLKLTLIVFAVIAMAAAGGGVVYQQHKNDQQYAKNFFKALYGIKAGEDSRLALCARISSEWTEAAKYGRVYSPRINAEDEAKAERIKTEVGKLLQQLQKMPKKNAQAFIKLTELNKLYLDLCSLTASPPRSLEEFSGATDKLKKSFTQKAQELKASLPERLSKEFGVAKLKYRGLGDL